MPGRELGVEPKGDISSGGVQDDSRRVLGEGRIVEETRVIRFPGRLRRETRFDMAPERFESAAVLARVEIPGRQGALGPVRLEFFRCASGAGFVSVFQAAADFQPLGPGPARGVCFLLREVRELFRVRGREGGTEAR